MKCPCQGRPGLVLANTGDDNCEVVPYACSYCDGTGEDKRDPLWIAAGKLQRKARIDGNRTLMDIARMWDVSPIDISEMERGLKEPLLHYIKAAREESTR